MRSGLLILALLTGVGCTADTAFTRAADEFSTTVGTEWVAYVTADEKLTLLEKQTRIDTFIRFREAVAAKKEADAEIEKGVLNAE